MKLFFKKIGEGPPMIILHGLFGSGDNWLTIAKKFSDRYSVYLPDIRNHGQSPHSRNHSYNEMTNDLYQFIQDHQIVNPIIIGHSMGGKIAMNFTIDHPEIPQKIVVVDIAPKMYHHENKSYIESMLAINLDQIKSRDEAEKILTDRIPEKGVRLFLLKNLYRKDDLSFGWRLNLKSIYENLKLIEGYITDKSSDINSLFIQGELSKYIQDEDYPLIKKVFPNSKIVKIQRTGHWLHAEKPEEVYQAISDFIDS